MTQTQQDSVAYLPAGYTVLTPFLCVDGGAAAIDFYTSVFGARVVRRFDLPDGRVAEAELELADCRFQLGDPNAEHGIGAPDPDAPVTHSYIHCCPDVDATYTAAVRAGASGHGAPATFVTGDRYAVVRDPFGHRWVLMTRVDDVPADEAERRVEEWLSGQGS
jgi:PhnB protein